jgi:hypothetical protein
VPVRYDPADHSTARLDVPALEAPLEAAGAAQAARRDAALASLGEPAADPPPEAAVDLSSAGSGASGSDLEDRLRKLADLRDRGALNDAEFAAAKAQILGES